MTPSLPVMPSVTRMSAKSLHISRCSPIFLAASLGTAKRRPFWVSRQALGSMARGGWGWKGQSPWAVILAGPCRLGDSRCLLSVSIRLIRSARVSCPAVSSLVSNIGSGFNQLFFFFSLKFSCWEVWAEVYERIWVLLISPSLRINQNRKGRFPCP